LLGFIFACFASATGGGNQKESQCYRPSLRIERDTRRQGERAMRKNIFRNLGLALTLAAVLAAPLKTFADDPIVGGTNPDPGNGGSDANYIMLVLTLATA
jgi:hypothetical protein